MFSLLKPAIFEFRVFFRSVVPLANLLEFSLIKSMLLCSLFTLPYKVFSLSNSFRLLLSIIFVYLPIMGNDY